MILLPTWLVQEAQGKPRASGDDPETLTAFSHCHE